jgi:hypothetical protein
MDQKRSNNPGPGGDPYSKEPHNQGAGSSDFSGEAPAPDPHFADLSRDSWQMGRGRG